MSSPSPLAPVVLAGMHRSGTSLVASLLASAGIDMGGELLRGDRSNPHGYFEDLAFLDLQRRLLAAAVAGGQGGHPDWGWVESGGFDGGALAAGREEARALVERGRARGRPWGWKDPRTSLLLDYWDEILEGDARYLLLYREPWEVAESMQRSGAAVWVGNPGYGWRIWCAYNERLLEFRRRHPDRALLVSLRGLLAAPARFATLARSRLGIELPDPEGLLAGSRDPELLRTVGSEDPLPSLWLRTHPEAARALLQLENLADLPSGAAWPERPSRLTPREGAVLSVVVPCFDMGEFVVDAVASVERTAVDHCELLVVDDGSSDEATRSVLAAMDEAGYRILRQANGGLASARNHGIRAANGRYVLPLDADNRLLPGFLAGAIAVLDAQPAVGVVFGDREDFGMHNGRVAVPEMDVGAFLWCNYIDACAVMRRDVWERSGGYDADASVWEDWDLWMSALEQGWDFHRLSQPTFEYRVRPASMLAGERARERWSTALRHMYDKHAELLRRELQAVLLAGQEERVRLHDDIVAKDSLRERLEQVIWKERRDFAGLQVELQERRQRLEFIESTRAWRLRRALLRWRGRPPES